MTSSLPPEAAALVREDGSVVVPAPLAGPVLRMAAAQLQRIKEGAGGGTPSESVLLLLWALRIAELRHAEVAAVAGSARGTTDGGSASVGDAPRVNSTQAAVLMGCSPAYVRRLCRTGRLPAEKVARDWLVDVTGLQVATSTRRSA